MTILIIKEASRSGDNVTYGVFFDVDIFGATVEVESFEFVLNFPPSNLKYVSHIDGDLGVTVSNAKNVGVGHFNLASFAFPTKIFDTDAPVLLITFDAAKTTGLVEVSLSDIVFNTSDVPPINTRVFTNNSLPTGTITITGTAIQGETLTAENTLSDIDGLGDLSYQWYAGEAAIAGATSSTLVLGQSQVGEAIKVEVAYTDGYGTEESVTSAATSSVENVNDAPTGTITITGTATQGETLTAENTLSDIDGLGDLSYQWYAGENAIEGATSSTLVLDQSLVGEAIKVEVSYTDGQGTAESVTSAATSSVENVNDAPTGTITITGTATQGETLTAENTLSDLDGLSDLSYQWYAGENAIEGATSSTLVLGQSLVGEAIKVEVAYTDGYGTEESVTSAATSSVENVNDAPTGTITITGTATQGETLTAENTLSDIDGLGDLSYQWYAGENAIEGATSSTLVLGQSLVGEAIKVEVSYTDGQGTAESVTSAATSSVENVNDAPSGSVTITGTATQGETLTAENTLSDLDGLSDLSYQWYAGENAIEGATSSTLVLGQSLVGEAIKVEVAYTDGYGTEESVTSAATSSVENVNDAPTGTITITGTATQGETLTAENTLSDIDGLGDLSYQWYAGENAIEGATSSTLVLGQSLVGEAIKVEVSYTDGQGTAESVTSAATSSVENVNDAPSGSVTITGTATQGETLTAENTLSDIDGLGDLSYQWYAGEAAIAGATSSTLVLGQSQVGEAIKVEVSYTDGQGTAESVTSAATSSVENVNDAPTGTITITGTAIQGENLTAENTLSDIDGLGDLSYQWYAGENAIEGATSSTLVLDQSLVGEAIKVEVAYTDGYGTDESVTSAATSQIKASDKKLTTTVVGRDGSAFEGAEIEALSGQFGTSVTIQETDTADVYAVVANYSADVSSIDFKLSSSTAITDFTAGSALEGWTGTVNDTVSGVVSYSAFGAVDDSLNLAAGNDHVLATFKLGDATTLSVTEIMLNEDNIEDVIITHAATDSVIGNTTVMSIDAGHDVLLNSTLSVDAAADKSVGAWDALQALRIVVGLSPMQAGYVEVDADAFHFIAADINRDGKVRADDALNILKYAVGFEDYEADWVFIDSAQDLSGVTKANVAYSEGVSIHDMNVDVEAELTAILVGDVDGSYFG